MKGLAGLVLRWGITAGAVAVAAWIVPGITVAGDQLLTVLLVALVLGLVNAFVRPILAALSCGLIVLTLGLFMLVINTLMLWLASWIAVNWLGLEFEVDGFWSALLGSVIITIVSFLVSVFVGGRTKA